MLRNKWEIMFLSSHNLLKFKNMLPHICNQITLAKNLIGTHRGLAFSNKGLIVTSVLSK